MSEPDTYVALKPCGCMVAATVDSPERKRDVARTVSGFIRGGFRVERVPSKAIREGKYSFGCGVCKPRVIEQMEMEVDV